MAEDHTRFYTEPNKWLHCTKIDFLADETTEEAVKCCDKVTERRVMDLQAPSCSKGSKYRWYYLDLGTIELDKICVV